MFVTVKHPIRGDVVIPGWPVKMTESTVGVTTSPLLGEHNDTIYGELLGYSPERVAELREEKVI
jgi:crotonobetainyl-CoA:carnitine CoA-transferase CaiB-like acyl-CoA transferase